MIFAFLSDSDYVQAAVMLAVAALVTFVILWYCDKRKKEAGERGKTVEEGFWFLLGYAAAIPIWLLVAAVIGASATP